MWLFVPNIRVWLFHQASSNASQFFSKCVSVCPHIHHSPGLLSMLYSDALLGEGYQNKKISQLIHLQAQKSHYASDEFKGCLEWKQVVFMAWQSCVPRLILCGKQKTCQCSSQMNTEHIPAYFMIVHLFKLNLLNGWDVLFVCWQVNEDLCGWGRNWSDLSHHMRDMNHFISTILV